ncbi:MAG: tRNA epoxyqueuosine(34) reductase QueG [Planctomycetes bacterium]|nr:tRNA epoxyqueuosine(34) reductase QueG [Planctomycetota bacterium]
MTPHRTAIRSLAADHGLERCGFAAIEALPNPEHYRAWIGSGMHGEMTYMARDAEKRLDPRRYLPGARTMICLAANYHTPAEPGLKRQEGRIARYAWGRDYHDVLKERLDRFCVSLRNLLPGRVVRPCVDTSPVLEKVWAQRAGIGWEGKNANVILRHRGSWVFLAEVLTDAEITPDPPHADFCGKCTRCIDVCPTRAIVAPYVVDARRCISYLTIEHRGPIDRDLRPLMGNHVFGCDDCQDVCPWNRFSRPDADPAFLPTEATRPHRLVELLRCTPAEFRERYRRTPIWRAKRRGFLRNVAIAIGNSGDRSAVPALIEALADPEPLVRGHVAWALGRLGGPAARRALEAAEKTESEAWVREEMQAAPGP